MKILGYKDDLSKVIGRKSIGYADAIKTVSDIIAKVKSDGDKALLQYAKDFDKSNITAIKVSQQEIDEAYAQVGQDFINALTQSKKNLEKVHKKQLEGIAKKWSVKVEPGIEVGERFTPIESVGCYVPGGLAPYPSTVLMTCIPAKIAGVKRIVVSSPPKIPPQVLAACKICQVDEVYQVGGAQAVAALAYGTETVRPVNKVVGPGNKFVTAAKMQCYGRIDIDMPAGPSEILVIADESANPDFIAWDVLAQAEHDPNAQCVLTTTSKDLAEKVFAIVEARSQELLRKDIVKKSMENIHAIIVKNLDEAVEFANDYAPEHLEVMAKNPEKIAGKIKNAGAIFIGEYAPVAAGDYASGGNHVLPTSGAAKYASQLNVRDFLKSTSTQKIERKGLEKIAKTIKTISRLEGLEAHGKSVEERLK